MFHIYIYVYMYVHINFYGCLLRRLKTKKITKAQTKYINKLEIRITNVGIKVFKNKGYCILPQLRLSFSLFFTNIWSLLSRFGGACVITLGRARDEAYCEPGIGSR